MSKKVSIEVSDDGLYAVEVVEVRIKLNEEEDLRKQITEAAENIDSYRGLAPKELN